MRNRNKQNKITKKQEQNQSTEEAQKHLLDDDDSIDSKKFVTYIITITDELITIGKLILNTNYSFIQRFVFA